MTNNEANKLLKIHGLNIIENKKKFNYLKILFKQIINPLILILILSCFLTFYLDKYNDAVFILIAVILNITLSYYQELKAENAINNLKKLLKNKVIVIRDNKEIEIDTIYLVPGDIIKIRNGESIPADAIIINSIDTHIDESILTGESLSIKKEKGQKIFAGTLLIEGLIEAEIINTGKNTEFGKIANAIENQVENNDILNNDIKSITYNTTIIVILFTVLLFIFGYIYNYNIKDIFLLSIAIAVSSIPEGLPITLTIILSLGALSMSRNKAVTRKLSSAEIIGHTSIILTDKTGTLTEGVMHLSKMINLSHINDIQNKIYSALTTNVIKDENNIYLGKILEIEIYKQGEKYINNTHKLEYRPFNSHDKYSSALIKNDNKIIQTFLGAPDILANHIDNRLQNKYEILELINNEAKLGKRILALGVKEIKDENDKNVENIIISALFVFEDKIKENIKDSIAMSSSMGIKTIILTGDHVETAKNIANQIGISTDKHEVLTSEDLINIDDDKLKTIIGNINVFARVTPLDKLRIVKIFQELNNTVLFIGDGVNDSPSIKKADIGICMGNGTEVSKSVSDLVLLDNNYQTVIKAIEEGKQIVFNIKKVIIYFLIKILNGPILFIGSIFFALPLPISPMQILWINAFSDSFPTMSFAFEKNKSSTQINIISMKYLYKYIYTIGFIISVSLFILYFIMIKLNLNIENIKTIIYACFGTYMIFISLSIKNIHKNILKYSWFKNIYLNISLLISLIFTYSIILIPKLSNIFDIQIINKNGFIIVLLFSLYTMIISEIGKKYLINAKI